MYVAGWPELEGGGSWLAQQTVDFTTATSLPSGYTYSRGTTALMQNASGVWSSYGGSDPLLVAGKGLFCPGGYTNYSLSTAFEGRTNGVIGSGGVVANGWVVSNGTSSAELTVVGGGVENGIPYTDVTVVSNSLGGTTLLTLLHGGLIAYAGSAGDKFTDILNFRITGTHPTHPLYSETRVHSYIVGGTSYFDSPAYIQSIPFIRNTNATITGTAANGSGNFVIHGCAVYGNFTGAAVNATYRIYSPNFVKLPFAPAGGSMLVPNASSTAASVSNAALCTRDLSWLSPPYSFCVEFKTMDDVTTERRIMTIGADSNNRSVDLSVSGGVFSIFASKAGANEYIANHAAVAANTIYRIAGAITEGRMAFSVNGNAVILDGVRPNETVAPHTLRLGYYWGNILHGFCFIRKLVGPVPGTWTDAQLQAMSAL